MTTLTVSEAQKLLTKLPPGVKLELQQTPDGEIILTAEKPQTKEELLKADYAHLLDQPITLTEAAKKYDIPRATIAGWVYSNKYISLVDGNIYPQTFNEAEIAYCADIYHERKTSGIGHYGAPLLTDGGLPYTMRYPKRAEKRKKKTEK